MFLCLQEYLRLQEQSRRSRQRYNNSYYARYQPKPLFRLLQEAMLSEKDLAKIQSERLQYTQLLYRWVI
jgi:hypothetical protein